jgi:hypothetical protein
LLKRSSHWIRALTCFALLAGLSALPSSSEVELVLKDGRVLKGIDVRRDGDLYELRTEDGIVPIPGALVDEVRLIETKPEPVPVPQPGFINPGPQQIEGVQPAQGMIDAEPEVLAGELIVPPRPSEQTAVLGEPSKFQKGVFDPNWQPSTDWDMSQENNNFAPSTWQDSIIDESWHPSSDYSADTDVADFAPSTFTEDIIDPHWQPQDAFKKDNKKSGSWPSSALPDDESFEFASTKPVPDTAPRHV